MLNITRRIPDENKFLACISGLGDEDSKRPSRMQQQSLNSELILSKEQLYDMFQQILGVKKFEHQLLFNALMVGNIRRMISVKFRIILILAGFRR